MPEHLAEQNAYRVEPADLDADARTIIDLWSSNLGHAERRQGKFDWFYRDNPAGQPYVLLLRHGQCEAAVGTVGIGSRSMRCGTEPISAGLMGDFAVDTQHRTLFPALTLQRAVLTQGLARHPILYGFPNAKSLPVVMRAGFAVMGHLGRYACILRLSGHQLPHALPAPLRTLFGRILDTALHLGRRVASALLDRDKHLTAWLDAPDERFDALWEAQAGTDSLVIGRRDRAFLHWRFVQKPSRSYRFFTLTERRSGRLSAYAVCEPGGETLHIRDFLCAPAWQSNLASLLRALARDAARQGYTRMSMEFLGPAELTNAMREAGMLLRDPKSQSVILAANPERASCLEGKNWYLTGADADE